MSVQAGLTRGLSKHRELVLVTFAALVVRLVWNLRVHPPLDYVVSDMKGYLDRASWMLDHPWERNPSLVLYPYGTHTLLYVVKRLFGRGNGEAIGVTYAMLGAVAVAFTHALAARLTRRRWVPRVASAILVFYYPWISLGGYALSEIPFTVFLGAAAFFALRLADRGRPLDAWLLGLSVAVGATFRPQILASLPLLGIHLVARHRYWRRFSPRLLTGVLVPVLVVLVASAARIRWHTGELGLISANGPLNYAFGRCHALQIEALSPSGHGLYKPSAFGALHRYQQDHPDSLLTLDPAMGLALSVEGHMWEAGPLERLASACVRETGLARQVTYSVTHLVLLWGYNVMWPDSKREPMFRRPMEVFGTAHTILLLPAAGYAAFLSFQRRRGRVLLVSLHVYGLLAVAMLYFGETRLRAPYDGMIVLLAVQTYSGAFRAFSRRALPSDPSRGVSASGAAGHARRS